MFEWNIEHLPGEDILYLKSKGVMRVPDANAMVKAMADAAVQYQCLTHLVDHRETTFDFRFMDYYERPSINEKLGVTRGFRTAMVFRELTKDTMFMETVFQNRGYQLRHFTDIEQAKEWLKKK